VGVAKENVFYFVHIYAKLETKFFEVNCLRVFDQVEFGVVGLEKRNVYSFTQVL
jgi:hypothetical protein